MNYWAEDAKKHQAWKAAQARDKAIAEKEKTNVGLLETRWIHGCKTMKSWKGEQRWQKQVKQSSQSWIGWKMQGPAMRDCYKRENQPARLHGCYLLPLVPLLWRWGW